MAKPNFHVAHRDAIDKWEVKQIGNSRASKLTDTKQEAMDYARERAKTEKVDVIPHHKDTGRITNPNSYGRDPRNIRDRKH